MPMNVYFNMSRYIQMILYKPLFCQKYSLSIYKYPHFDMNIYICTFEYVLI